MNLIVVYYELFGIPQSIAFFANSQYNNWFQVMDEAYPHSFEVKAILGS